MKPRVLLFAALFFSMVSALVAAEKSPPGVAPEPGVAGDDPLEKIIIPKIDFRDSTLAEVAEFLTRRNKRDAADGVGFDFLVRDEKLRAVRVTFSVKAAPLSAIVRYCALLADCDVVKEKSAFAFALKDPNPPSGRAVGLQPARLRKGTLARAAGIQVPRVDFQESTFREVIEFMQAKSAHLDPTGEGVNIVLKEGPEIGAIRVTQKIETISLADVLRIIAGGAGYEIVDDDFALIIRPKTK